MGVSNVADEIKRLASGWYNPDYDGSVLEHADPSCFSNIISPNFGPGPMPQSCINCMTAGGSAGSADCRACKKAQSATLNAVYDAADTKCLEDLWISITPATEGFGCYGREYGDSDQKGWLAKNWLWILLIVIAVCFFMWKNDDKKNATGYIEKNPVLTLVCVGIIAYVLYALVSRSRGSKSYY